MEELMVRLTKPSLNYDIGHHNPVVGSEWECVGYVTQIDVDDTEILEDEGGFPENELAYLAELVHGTNTDGAKVHAIHVYWENDAENDYKIGELTVQNNIFPRCNSIW